MIRNALLLALLAAVHILLSYGFFLAGIGGILFLLLPVPLLLGALGARYLRLDWRLLGLAAAPLCLFLLKPIVHDYAHGSYMRYGTHLPFVLVKGRVDPVFAVICVTQPLFLMIGGGLVRLLEYSVARRGDKTTYSSAG